MADQNCQVGRFTLTNRSISVYHHHSYRQPAEIVVPAKSVPWKLFPQPLGCGTIGISDPEVMAANDKPSGAPHSAAPFATTHWSVVLAAGQTASEAQAAALDKLCSDYWYPLYAYLRRSGHSPHEAEDLTQEFFASRVVTKRVLQGIQPGSGRFRSWLLCGLQNLVRNEWEKEQAVKRGGGQPHLSLDFQSAEGRYVVEPAHDLTPEKLYERSWAHQLLDLTTDRLEAKYRQDDKADLFEELKMFLPGEWSTRSYAEVAARLGRSEDAVKMMTSRFRQEYGRILKAEVERIVDNPADVNDELRCLLGALETG